MGGKVVPTSSYKVLCAMREKLSDEKIPHKVPSRAVETNRFELFEHIGCGD